MWNQCFPLKLIGQDRQWWLQNSKAGSAQGAEIPEQLNRALLEDYCSFIHKGGPVWFLGGAAVSLWHKDLSPEWGKRGGAEWQREGGTSKGASHPAQPRRAPLSFLTRWRENWTVNGVWNVKCEWTLSNWHGASASLPISFFLLMESEKMFPVSSSF